MGAHGSGGGPVRWLHLLRVRRPSPADAADWEIEHHLREATDRLVAEGLTPGEARAEAERRFGSVRRYRGRLRRAELESSVSRRGRAAWHAVSGGVGAAGRTLRREPAFAAAVVLTLALGIGANATMYGIVDRLLLRAPEHVVAPEGVRRVVIDRVAWSGSNGFADYLDLLENRAVSRAAAYTGPLDVTLGGGAGATRVRVGLATASFLPVLGVQPALGRSYGPDEDRPEAPPTALLGWEYWRRELGGDPDVLGRTLELRGHPFTVIGVLPEGFTGVDLEPVDVWLPLETWQSLSQGADRWRETRESRGSFFLRAVVRLASGASLEAAEAEATRIHLNAYRVDVERGAHSPESTVRFEPLIRARGSEASPESKVARWLMGVSALVLLIACANVANLFLARSARRQRETSVRLALGISRRRLVGEAVMESVLLALAGGAAALLLARWGGDAVRRVLLPNVLFSQGAVGGRVLLYSAGVAVLAGVLASLAPAFQAAARTVCPGAGAGGYGFSRRRSRFRGALTAAQAAMCVVLLVGAALFVRSVREVRTLDLGLDVDRLVLAQIEWGADLAVSERNALYHEALERALPLPGVEAAALASVPFGTAMSNRLRVPGFDSFPRLPGGGPYFYGVGAGYFRTAGIQVLEGREFESSDGLDGPRVAVVSRTMAEAFWPGEGALGRCLIVGESEECSTVVGVVDDASRYGITGHMPGGFGAYYVPVAQDPDRALQALYVRAARDPRQVAEPVASLLRGFSPHVRYATAQTLRERIDPQARSWTLGASLFSVFGLLALAVAAVGLYSVLAFDVAQRARELGIRSALGAARAHLLVSVVLRGARLAGIGVALGLVAAWLAAPRIADLLFEVSPREPVVLSGVAVLLLLVAVAASLLPAVRATRVDPAEVLRRE